MTVEIEAPQASCCPAAISRSPWKTLNGHGRLVVLGGREDLALLGRDRGVAIDEAREHAAKRLDAQRKRGDIEQQHVLHIALQHAGLNGRADRDDLIRVHTLVRLLAEEGFTTLLNLRHAGHAADEHHFVDLTGLNAGILQRLLARLNRALDEIIDQALELGTAELEREMLRTGSIGGDVGQVDFGLERRGQLDLGLFGRFLEALEGELVLLEVNALLLLELVGKIFDEAHVEIFTPEEGVTIGGFHLEDAIADFQDGDIEGAAAKVIDRNGAGSLSCRGRRQAQPPSAR